MTTQPGPSSAPPAGPPLRWWEGVASPGPAGYLLAVALSAPLLGVLVVLVEAATGSGSTDLDGAFWGVLLFGWALSFVVAPPGVLLVHLASLRVRQQAVHVVLAGLAGVVAGAVFLGTFGSADEPFPLLLGAATALARACVVPLVPGVRRRRVERARRRAGLEQLAAQGVVDGYGAPHRRPGDGATADFGPGDRPR